MSWSKGLPHRLRLSPRRQRSFFTRDSLRSTIERYGLEIGEWTYGAPKIFGLGESDLSIGRYCSIARGVQIFLGYEHNTTWITTFPFPDALLLEDFPEGAEITGHPRSKGPVRIGSDVWIGHEAMILSGVTIGDGAVIGAGSVVTSNVLPYAIVAGAPARVVRQRFDDDTVRRLLALSWWDWPDIEVRRALHLLCSPDLGNLAKLEEISHEVDLFLSGRTPSDHHH